MITHEEDCPCRSVACLVLNCCDDDVRFYSIEDHMDEEHTKLSKGQWQIIPAVRLRGSIRCNSPGNVLIQARLNKTEIESNKDNIPLDAKKRQIEVQFGVRNHSQ